jgi:hypothetical protein
MPRTLMPTPDDPEPSGPPRLSRTRLDLGDLALLDVLRSDCAPVAPAVPVASSPADLAHPTELITRDGPGDEALTYLPVASSCFAVIQYDPTTARLVRRVVGMFGDVQDAERYGMENGYRLYDVVPAIAVIARPATAS